MPDAWETLHGLNPADASDGPLDADGDIYTNVEEYLNDTDPLVSQADSNRGKGEATEGMRSPGG